MKSSELMRWFDSSHLPEYLKRIMEECAHLARYMDEHLSSQSSEKEAGMRKLMEAKDCFVRARVQAREDQF